MTKQTKKVAKNSFIIPIFNQKVEIFIGPLKNVQSLWDKEDYFLDIPDNADGACFGLNDCIGLWFEANPKISIIVHECCHVVYEVMRSRGLNMEDEEMFCYLQEYIVDNVLKCVKRMLPTVTDRTNQKSKQEGDPQ